MIQLPINQPLRFDAYEVRPVVEEQISDGTSICHPYNGLNEAEEFIADSTRGQTGWPREGYTILWTLYGHRDGEGVEAICDLDNEKSAFDLLYSITGIRGVSGQTVYPLSDEVPLVDTNAVLTKLASAIDAIDHYKLTEEVDSLALAEEAIGDAEALIQRHAVQDGVGILQRFADAIIHHSATATPGEEFLSEEKPQTALFSVFDVAATAAQPGEYIVAVEWLGQHIQFTTALDPRRLPQPKIVVVQQPKDGDGLELFITNPDPQVGRFEITQEQLKALRIKFERDAHGAESFETFKSRASPAGVGTDRYIVLPWCGMWLAIEPDGYTHS